MSTATSLQRLVVQFATENPSWRATTQTIAATAELAGVLLVEHFEDDMDAFPRGACHLVRLTYSRQIRRVIGPVHLDLTITPG